MFYIQTLALSVHDECLGACPKMTRKAPLEDWQRPGCSAVVLSFPDDIVPKRPPEVNTLALPVRYSCMLNEHCNNNQLLDDTVNLVAR